MRIVLVTPTPDCSVCAPFRSMPSGLSVFFSLSTSLINWKGCLYKTICKLFIILVLHQWCSSVAHLLNHCVILSELSIINTCNTDINIDFRGATKTWLMSGISSCAQRAISHHSYIPCHRKIYLKWSSQAWGIYNNAISVSNPRRIGYWTNAISWDAMMINQWK